MPSINRLLAGLIRNRPNQNSPSFTGTMNHTGAITASSTVSGSSLSTTGSVSGGSATITGLASSGSIQSGTGQFTGKVSVVYDGGATISNNISMFEIQDNGVTKNPSMEFHCPSVWATKITLQGSDNKLYFGGYSAATGGQTIVSGHHEPGANNTYDLGSASLRWRNIYTQDLHLSNGIGDYTIVEGEEDLFLYNNKNNKTYKFALIEVDPSEAPEKMKSQDEK